MASTSSKRSRGKAGGRNATAKDPGVPRKANPKKRKGTEITPEIRYRMIAEAAYLRAEQAGFGGDPVEHWLTAERQIDAMLAEGATGTAQ